MICVEFSNEEKEDILVLAVAANVVHKPMIKKLFVSERSGINIHILAQWSNIVSAHCKNSRRSNVHDSIKIRYCGWKLRFYAKKKTTTIRFTVPNEMFRDCSIHSSICSEFFFVASKIHSCNWLITYWWICVLRFFFCLEYLSVYFSLFRCEFFDTIERFRFSMRKVITSFFSKLNKLRSNQSINRTIPLDHYGILMSKLQIYNELRKVKQKKNTIMQWTNGIPAV